MRGNNRRVCCCLALYSIYIEAVLLTMSRCTMFLQLDYWYIFLDEMLDFISKARGFCYLLSTDMVLPGLNSACPTMLEELCRAAASF
ncbi:uncharacterized protein BDW47DRAFT_4301 [Aspergillus candidus]|uniref:Uncharacterized protein n=1 Tax=Aspergillus candidus TaxID=41067 RepID=A0A2I2FH70_ASPCN|nr:hypothetical protein BDW47DRAFT_4301 [Aspergillus candidus]PLB39964.1 hypothetical protein BDW47DRAFT_4301 [Aspergillus candidus]